MVNSDNLTAIVGRLMRQLRNAPVAASTDDPANDRGRLAGVVPYAESDDSEAEETLHNEKRSDQPPPLPEDYRITVIRRILEMCSKDTYANITDFEWYIDVLVQLVRVSPATKSSSEAEDVEDLEESDDVSHGIGRELQNVAVRVKSVRSEAVDAAQSLVLIDRRDQMFPASGNGGLSVLEYAGWIVGEYANWLTNPEAVMTSLLHSSSAQLPSKTLAIYIQAVPKVFARMASDDQVSWTPERKTLMSLLMARIIHFLEPLSTHPSLEVQERAVEYLELIRLAAEAASGTATGDTHGDFAEPPLLLTQAIPALFSGAELNPVAAHAQRKVPIPEGLDLDSPINPNLYSLLAQAETENFETEEDEVYAAYSEAPLSYVSAAPQSISAAQRLEVKEKEAPSYQNAVEEEYLDPDIIARRKAERKERYRDDPFYIDPDKEQGSGTATPLGNIIRAGNEEVDIDAIPIMDLDLGNNGRSGSEPHIQRARSPRKAPRRVEIMGDETLGPNDADSSGREDIVAPPRRQSGTKAKKSLLEVDSSVLGSLSLDDDDASGRKMTRLEIERKEQEDAEMKKALAEVERLRLEMQRANERIEARGEVTVKKKKKKVRKADIAGEAPPVEPPADAVETGEGEAAPKKKKKKKVKAEGDAEGAEGDQAAVKKKKKKRRQVVLDEDQVGNVAA
jgi:AP-3 complex subunit delta-1